MNFLALATATQMANTAYRLPDGSRVEDSSHQYQLGAERPPDSSVFFVVGDGKILPEQSNVSLRVAVSNRDGFSARSLSTAILEKAELCRAVIHFDESGSSVLGEDFEIGWDLDVGGGALLPEEVRFPVFGLNTFGTVHFNSLVNRFEFTLRFQAEKGFWYSDFACTERTAL